MESEAALREVHDHLPQETAPDGKPWNWNADAHIRAVLRLLGANLDKKAYPKTEKTGDPSTSADALRTIKKPEKARQWVDAYLKYGTLRKQYNDFARQYASLIRPTARSRAPSTPYQRAGSPVASRTSSRCPAVANARARETCGSETSLGQGWGEVHSRGLLPGGAPDRRYHRRPGDRGARAHAGSLPEGWYRRPHRHGGHHDGWPPPRSPRASVPWPRPSTSGWSTGPRRDPAGVRPQQLRDRGHDPRGCPGYRRAFFERYPELAAWHRLVEARCDRGSNTPRLPWDASGSSPSG